MKELLQFTGVTQLPGMIIVLLVNFTNRTEKEQIIRLVSPQNYKYTEYRLNKDSFRTDAVGETSTLPPSVSMHHERRQQRDYSTVDNHRDGKRSRNRRSDGKRRRRRSRERSPPRE